MALPRLLGNRRARRLLGLALVAQGLLGFLAPRLAVKLSARLSLREAYENPGDLEPTDAYVDLVRDASLATLVFGALTLLRAGAVEPDPDGLAGEQEVADTDADAESETNEDTETETDTDEDDHEERAETGD